MQSDQRLSIVLRHAPVADLAEYASIPSEFESGSVFDVVQLRSGVEVAERRISVSYRKNYDDLENPLTWPISFDTSGWTLIWASIGELRVGGVIVAGPTPGVEMLEERQDLAVIWDLRVSPAHRRLSIGTALFAAAETWARTRGCRELKVETQNTNVPACKLYRQNGCAITQARPGVYPDVPGDVQLIWRKRLDG